MRRDKRLGKKKEVVKFNLHSDKKLGSSYPKFTFSSDKCVLLLITTLLLLIISLSSISSIGITPGRTTLNFEPSLQQQVSFSVVNTEKQDMSVVFTISGELADYITLNQAYAEFSAGEEVKSFSYSLNLPAKFNTPGLHTAEIAALQMPKNIAEQGTFIGATVGVATQVHVYVPYPDKYVEAEVNIIESGGEMMFFVPVINRGKLDIVNVKAQIDIFTALNEEVATIETNTDSLNSLERKELLAKWIPNLPPGKYLAVATVIYDNEIAKAEKQFNIGEMLLEILEVNVKDFVLGEIAKFDALVENKWGNDLRDVYLNLIVYNEEGEIMADFKSPNYDISALSKLDMVAYWDTGGVHEGTYNGKIVLVYGEGSKERNIQLKISSDSIEVVGLTGKVIVTGKTQLNVQNILVIAVVVLIIMNIIWFFIIKRFIKKRK